MTRNPPKNPSDADRVQDARDGAISGGTDRLGYRGACLVVIYGDDLGKIHELNAKSSVIGRSPKCEIPIEHGSISRNHSKVENTGTSMLIRDLGSTNGTYVNDEPIEECVLCDGDLVKVGRTIFKFLAGGNIERAYHEQMYRLVTANRSTEAPPSAGERSRTTTMPQEATQHGDEGPKKGA